MNLGGDTDRGVKEGGNGSERERERERVGFRRLIPSLLRASFSPSFRGESNLVRN